MINHLRALHEKGLVTLHLTVGVPETYVIWFQEALRQALLAVSSHDVVRVDKAEIHWRRMRPQVAENNDNK